MPYHESPMPTSAEADEALYVAVLQVCESSFFAFVESSDPVQFAVLVAKTERPSVPRHGGVDAETAAQRSGWLKGSVTFDGTSSSGVIEVILSEHLARFLVASLLGISREVETAEVELLDDQVFDGIGELANMICGAWLTDLGSSQAFNIGSPAVVHLPASWNPQLELSRHERGHRLCIVGMPMRIVVRSSPE